MQGLSPAINWSKSYSYDTLGWLTSAGGGWPNSPTLTTSYQWYWSGSTGGLANLDVRGNWNGLQFGPLGSLACDGDATHVVYRIRRRLRARGRWCVGIAVMGVGL
jgi:hypothetical protein